MYKVLIVEDDPMVAMINEQYIAKNRDFQVVGKCRDGKSALAFLEKHCVDLLILDVYMPQMDGLATLRCIRNKNISVEAIMVTAANDRDSLEEALHLGIVDYLVKPFTFERFCMALEKFAVQNNALKDFDTLNQKNIDFIVDSSRKTGTESLPKGIQERTLLMIITHLNGSKERWLTGEEIAKETGLTKVTVRRYMNYLVEMGKAEGEMDYGTGGRPCMTYRMM